MEHVTERKLPATDVGGKDFYADAVNGELIDTVNQNNRISVHQMMNFNDHSEFLFDKVKGTIYEGDYSRLPLPDSVETVWIRPLSAIDPSGMEILMNEGRYKWAEHYLTPLPKLDFGGTDFFIDTIRGGFRQVDNRWNIILFNDINQTETLSLFFDSTVKNVPFPHDFNLYDPPSILPDHIIKVTLPSWGEINHMLKDVITVQNKYLIERIPTHEKNKNKRGFRI